MKNNNIDIDKMVSRILSEEIEMKSNSLADKLESEVSNTEFDKGACEYHLKTFGKDNERTKKFCGTANLESLDENKKLSPKQKKNLDVAEPKGKITSKDFEKLRSMKKKKEIDEFFYEDEEENFGDYQGDDYSEKKAESLSKKEPTYVGRGLDDNREGKTFGSFANSGEWYMETDRPFRGEFDFKYDEEEFDEFEPMYKKHGKNVNWFAPGREGKKYFDSYKQKFGGPFIVRTRIDDDLEDVSETLYEIEVDVDDNEFVEGNAFTDMLRKTKKGEKFKLSGKEYTDNSNLEESEKWIQKTNMKKGALKSKLGIPKDEKIPQSLMSKLKKELMSKAEGDKKLSKPDSKLLKQVNLAMNLKNLKESNNKLNLSEKELIDLIENLVLEQKKTEKNKIVGTNKNNISTKEATGLRKTQKVLSKNKTEGDQYFKDLTKKLTDYLKQGSKTGYEMNPKSFPKQNGQLDKEMKKKAYKASGAVEEYIENFAYPGMENLHYDEIKPNDEWLTKNLEGSSETGNNPEWANAEMTELGKKVNKKRKDNNYQKEKRKSYKRYTQPVDSAGESEGEDNLDKMFAKLESVEEKKKHKINEDMDKIKNLISYDRKTQ